MIFAIDFDGTLCKDEYPLIGSPNLELMDFIKHAKNQGHVFILWTCRSGKYLEDAVKWCQDYGIIFDAVNSNLQCLIDKYNNDCRKVYADIYIDDKSYTWSDYNEQTQNNASQKKRDD